MIVYLFQQYYSHIIIDGLVIMEAMCSGTLFAMKISQPQAGLKAETARSVSQHLTY